MSEIRHLLVLPRLRVQNANAISSSMTWGFPAMSAFIGLMHALERKLPEHLALQLEQVGVVCHDYQALVTNEGYTRAFHLTRNPVDKGGNTAAIVEEGRIHLELTLIFAVDGAVCEGDEQEKAAAAMEIADLVQGMRIAGGSVMPPLPVARRRPAPFMVSLGESSEDQAAQFKSLRYRCLPGFALVGRDGLLQARFHEMRDQDPQATRLDAWLDLSRINHECHRETRVDEKGESQETIHWQIRQRPGWLVPIPVGFGALTRLHEPGEVARTRDNTTPFRFVESLYSVGQWVSPHRLHGPEQLLWYVDNDLDNGLYRLKNDFEKTTTTA
ncbi:MAG: type I-F CRISPR-associated protein Csy2 [Alcanivoracaceae bacterium]